MKGESEPTVIILKDSKAGTTLWRLHHTSPQTEQIVEYLSVLYPDVVVLAKAYYAWLNMHVGESNWTVVRNGQIADELLMTGPHNIRSRFEIKFNKSRDAMLFKMRFL
jgi:hypothetical protein